MEGFRFSIPMTVRVSDLNYGNHVGYERYLTFFQEARMGYLARLGCSELDLYGAGIIVSEVNCKYKRELNLGDEIEVGARISSIKPKLFKMEYEIWMDQECCAEGNTLSFCFDYQEKKVARFDKRFIEQVKALED